MLDRTAGFARVPRALAGVAMLIACPATGAAQSNAQDMVAAQSNGNWMRRYDRPATYEVVTRHIMVPMRDGVGLATTLYFPARNGVALDGPFPVLLHRSMGDSRDEEGRNTEGRYFAGRGYVVARQTMRGRPPSEGGPFYLYGRQQHDGADAVEWLASQTWSTGKVGTFGVSHAGVAQYSLATENPNGLAAMVPAFAQSNYALWSMRTGGAVELRYPNWATGAAVVGSEAAADPQVARAAREERERFGEYLSRPPFLFELARGRSPLRHTPSYEDWLISIVEHGEYPGSDDFWKDPGFNLTPYYETMADVPIMHHSGWYDTYPRAKSDNWIALSKVKRSPQWLLLGPWTHTSAFPGFSGDVDFGMEAAGDYNQVRLRWFDQWLIGIETGLRDEPPVKVFVMGGGDEGNVNGRKNHGGFWRESHTWPLAETEYVRYYFHAGGGLGTDRPSEAESSTTYTFDPRNPVPTIGGNISAFGGYLEPGAFDQTCREDLVGCRDHLPLAARPDVVVFQTLPLSQDVEVTGYLKIVLHGASTGVDTDFTAKLVDVHPPTADYPHGYAMNVADGIIRARFRNGREKEELMTPGTGYEFVIEPYPTANLFRRGHRIRVDISSSNYPRFDVNPNTGEPILRHRRFQVVDNTIFHDARRASYIELPVIPRREAGSR